MRRSTNNVTTIFVISSVDNMKLFMDIAIRSSHAVRSGEVTRYLGHVDYCFSLLFWSPDAVTDKLQRVLILPHMLSRTMTGLASAKCSSCHLSARESSI